MTSQTTHQQEIQQQQPVQASQKSQRYLAAELSPGALAQAYSNWAARLCCSPGKQVTLIEQAMTNAELLLNCAFLKNNTQSNSEHADGLRAHDQRFSAQAWQKWPYNVFHQAFLLNQKWWQYATTGVDGVSQQDETVMESANRQMLNLFSPANYLLTNPEALEQTRKEGGQNLIRGLRYFVDDMQHIKPTDNPEPHKETFVHIPAIERTGKVIYQNELMELIQHESLIQQMQAEPILIVPAWIMKYYILDVSAQNVLVEYLTKQGFTVFTVVWKNSASTDGKWGMEDYRQLGVMEALNCINKLMGDTKVHGLGYFLGGTLLSIAAAAMAKNKNDRFKTLSLFASQVDFSETSEHLFSEDDTHVTFLENMMTQQHHSDIKKMTDSALLANYDDLTWSQRMRSYLMGEGNETTNEVDIDVESETADSSFTLHSQFLRELIKNNDFAAGRYKVDSKPIAISDINAPIFVVDTERDHVATWHSVYSISQLVDTDITFLLTNGGDYTSNDNQAQEPNRSYYVGTSKKRDKYIPPEGWLETRVKKQGSWWPELSKWLKVHSQNCMENPVKE